MRAGYYRPMVHHAVRVTLDKDGLPADLAPPGGHPVDHEGLAHRRPKFDDTAVEGAMGSPYLKATPVVDAQVSPPTSACRCSGGARWARPTPPSSWSTPSTSWPRRPARTRWSTAARSTPRPGSNRHLAVLNLAAEKAGWGRRRRPGGPRRGGARELRLGGGPDRRGEAGERRAPGRPRGHRHRLRHGDRAGPDRRPDGRRDLLRPVGGAVRQDHPEGRRRCSRPTSTATGCCAIHEAPTVETYIVPSSNPPSGDRRAGHAGDRPGRGQRPAGDHRQAHDVAAVREQA